MKKTAYFSPRTVDVKADAMLARLRRDITPRKIPFSIAKSALLVLDMQDFFLNPKLRSFIPSAGTVALKINSAVALFRAAGRPIIFTRHVNTEKNAKLMKLFWRELINGPQSNIWSGMDTNGATLLEKSQYDAFYDTRLEALLKRRKVTQLYICGVVTHLCCETTARSAFVRGFIPFIGVDTTADYNRPFHEAALRSLAHGFAVVATSGEILPWKK